MTVSRRQFLDFCKNAAAAVGLSTVQLGQLEKALANPNGPSVIWLSGSSCTGCSVSFLNRISTTGPQTAADVLVNVINLQYHPNLMAAAGESAARVAQEAMNRGGYILAVEGGVPTAFGGNTCWAWTPGRHGRDVSGRCQIDGRSGVSSPLHWHVRLLWRHPRRCRRTRRVCKA